MIARRVATLDPIQSSLMDFVISTPALKRRAKFRPPLRVEAQVEANSR